MVISQEKCDRIAHKIDAWVEGVLSQGGGDEQLLEGMYDYSELDALAMKYDGFYRFSNILGRFAQAIADGRINPDEFEPKPKKRSQKKGWAKNDTSFGTHESNAEWCDRFRKNP